MLETLSNFPRIKGPGLTRPGLRGPVVCVIMVGIGINPCAVGTGGTGKMPLVK